MNPCSDMTLEETISGAIANRWADAIRVPSHERWETVWMCLQGMWTLALWMDNGQEVQDMAQFLQDVIREIQFDLKWS